MANNNNNGFTTRMQLNPKNLTEGQIAFLIYEEILTTDQLKKLAAGTQIYIEVRGGFKKSFNAKWLAEVAHFEEDGTYCELEDEAAKKTKGRAICWVHNNGDISVATLSKTEKSEYMAALKKWRDMKPATQPKSSGTTEEGASGQTTGGEKPATPPAVNSPLSYRGATFSAPMTEAEKSALGAACQQFWAKYFTGKTPAQRLAMIDAVAIDLAEIKKQNDALVAAEKHAAEAAQARDQRQQMATQSLSDAAKQAALESLPSLSPEARKAVLESMFGTTVN